ncbi:DUF4230 domain-containing protein [Wukongibacter baidiensis]|uniref:DUF4230 domain-containing protein n=1 Tax=Wukongibacter baidiensis TaxID=1723361 RepID=UPI003D7F40FF
MKTIKTVLITILIMGVIIIGVVSYKNFSIEHQEKIGTSTIEEKIAGISELAVVKYNYKDIATFKDAKKVNGLNVPFGEKSFIIVFSGYVKAGVDLNNIDIEIDEENNKNVIVRIDNAKIIDNVINEEDAKVYDEKSNVFNSLSLEDLLKVLAQKKVDVEEELQENGFMEEANKRCERLIEGLLIGMGFEEVKVEFRN